ncbi:zinc-ribbon domain-containing protein [uncultured Methanobrevibacter sp.]|uniref:YfgJ family double zinc ribbon protein n=1 Tax=uncultured Methanobrevibacter sp. TaxID=253161 RepID=UPI0025E92CD9|nr:zinc-ribbon domain-containing protein [uncultured Methanobrevibacter sp.]
MVKCGNCGLDVSDDLENCPNCGSSLVKSEEINEVADTEIVCGNCGAQLKENESFCPSCGSEVKIEEDDSLKCESCGSNLPENTLFCPTCGTKVENVQKANKKNCPNCGAEIEDDITFCDKCGANVFTGEKNKQELVTAGSFAEKINLSTIIKPSIVALIVALILSVIGLLIGFSWFSFVIAIILSVGFFGAAIDNEANAIIFGLIVGLILGLLENPLVEFTYGAFVAGFYEGFFGGHLILIVILGAVMAYVSNKYLKESILGLTDNFKGML